MSEQSQMRVSNAERDRTVELLRGHAAEGRLEVEELEQRVEAALAARTRGELDALTADLPARPAPDPGRSGATPRSRVPAITLLAVALVATLVFAITGAAGWVMWTALGWGLWSLKTGHLTCASGPRRRHSHA